MYRGSSNLFFHFSFWIFKWVWFWFFLFLIWRRGSYTSTFIFYPPVHIRNVNTKTQPHEHSNESPRPYLKWNILIPSSLQCNAVNMAVLTDRPTGRHILLWLKQWLCHTSRSTRVHNCLLSQLWSLTKVINYYPYKKFIVKQKNLMGSYQSLTCKLLDFLI